MRSQTSLMSIPGDQHDWKTCVQVDNPAGFSIAFARVRSSPQRFDSVLSIVVWCGGHPTTNLKTPTGLRWGFLLSDCGDSCVLLGIGAEGCGRHRWAIRPATGHLSLSPGRYFLRSAARKKAEVRTRGKFSSLDPAVYARTNRAIDSRHWVAAEPVLP